MKARTIALLVLAALVLSPAFVLAGAKYAGVRSSSYGIDPFPTAEGWGNAMNAMASNFPGSQPAAIWIVGSFDSAGDNTVLEFPSDGQTHARISFSDIDKHEAYLNYFDQNGVKVFLQVDPGFADVNTLIDLVLNRYTHHPSVIGFGVDVEWYQNVRDDRPGVRVTDAVAKAWEGRIKSHNSSYRLFIKHYDWTYLCPTYRGDIVFVDDSQQFSGISSFVTEMTAFANRFYPNTVMYQIGYEADRPWWSKYANPPKSLGDALVAKTRQECGVFWVDFTLREVLPTDRTITGLDPSWANAGGPAFTLTVDGSNFVSGSKVRWNGSDRATTFVSSTEVAAAVTASDIAAAGAATVTVYNPAPGGGVSNGLRFDILPGLSSVTVNPSSVAGGTASTGTVTLNGPAPTGGAVVSLLSSNTSAAGVPATVTVSSGNTKATFTITTSQVSSPTAINISALYGGVTKSAILTVKLPSLSSVSISPSKIAGGKTSTGTVTLNGPAPGGGIVVSLSSGSTSVARVPGTVTVLSGNTVATFSISTSTVRSTKYATISASYSGVTKMTTLTVTSR